MAQIHYVGVRHHSPACARRTRDVLEKVKPAVILIEGPADMNDRLDEMLLGHKMPLALFTFANVEGQTRSCWTPFCEYSPEWVALTKGHAIGANVKFMDLPGWHKVFMKTQNRYADRSHDFEKAWLAVGEKLGVDGWDALWDHLFEQPLDADALGERLAMFFANLRADEDAGDRDLEREEYMLSWLRWGLNEAEKKNGDVLVVCGGFHAARFERTKIEPSDQEPEPLIPDEGVRVGSYLVPYSFIRLDSFTGYESGMPSPAYQQAIWDSGPEKAGETFLAQTVAALRKKKQMVSPADMIAASVMAEGLRMTRGHAVIGRTDLLDGIAAALVKDALEVPLPWTYRDVLRPRTDPVLVEVMRVFSGDVVGKLAAETPRPPLLDDARHELEAHDLWVEKERASKPVSLDLTKPADLEKSRILHRLRCLQIPGFDRKSGPAHATAGELKELWSVTRNPDAESALIEASMYGPTLEGAAAGKLEEALLNCNGRLGELSKILGAAVFVGVGTIAMRALTLVSNAVQSEPSLIDLGEAINGLIGLWRYDTLMGSAGSGQIKLVLEAAYDRGLWLVEGLQGAGSPADDSFIKAFIGLRDTARAAAAGLGVDLNRGVAVMERKSRDKAAPPAVQGAALGFVWSTADESEHERLAQDAETAVRKAAMPEMLGDFLGGLFALAREEVVHTPGLSAVIDEVIRDMTEDAFLQAIPALRMAFNYFPPMEREQIARQILRGYGRGTQEAKSMVKLTVGPEVLAYAVQLERAVELLMDKYGLTPGAQS